MGSIPDVSQWLPNVLQGLGFGGQAAAQTPGVGQPLAPIQGAAQGAAPPAPLAGAAPPSPVAPAAAPAAPAAPPAGQDLAGAFFGGQMPAIPKPGLLDNPMLQGLLSAYLGAIGSPKSAGLGGALSRGGITGLSAYNQAKAAQFAPYKTLADVMKDVASTKESLAGADVKSQEALAKKSIGDQNSKLADQIVAAAANQTDPVAKQGMLDSANMIRGNIEHPYTLEDISKNVTELTTQAKNRAEAGRATAEAARTQEQMLTVDPVDVLAKGAAASKDLAEAAKVPYEEAHLASETAAEKVNASKTEAERAKNVDELRISLGKQYDAYLKGRGWVQKALADPDVEAQRQQFIAAGLQKYNISPAGTTLTQAAPTTAPRAGGARPAAKATTAAPQIVQGAMPSGVTPTGRSANGGQYKEGSDGHWYAQ